MIIVNKPDVSRATAYSYGALLVFIVALVVFFSFSSVLTPLGIGGIIASIVSAFVGVVIGLILMSLYRTRYLLTDKDLIIKTTKLIGGSKIIPLTDVKSVKKTLIPFGLRLFGASFHGGYYHIPNLGRAFLTITNFKDGLLIETSKNRYIITPSNPEKFKNLIEKSKV
jgi:hypothetical protein